MPTPAYIKIEGSTQGLITANAFTADSVGNVYVEGHKDEILAQEIKHRVIVPTDPQTGQPTGRRIHDPFVFTCSLNKAVPLLYEALVSGELLPMITVRWYRTSAEGKQEHFFTTELMDGTIVEINTVLPDVLNQDSANYTQLVEVSIRYLAIRWIHNAAASLAIDHWRKPKETAV